MKVDLIKTFKIIDGLSNYRRQTSKTNSMNQLDFSLLEKQIFEKEISKSI